MPPDSDFTFSRYLVVVQKRGPVLIPADDLEQAREIGRRLVRQHIRARVAIVDFIAGTVLAVERPASTAPARKSTAPSRR